MHFAQDMTSALAIFLRQVEHRFPVGGALTVVLVALGESATVLDILIQQLLFYPATFSQIFSPAAKVRARCPISGITHL